jgi:hypothetical protein
MYLRSRLQRYSTVIYALLVLFSSWISVPVSGELVTCEGTVFCERQGQFYTNKPRVVLHALVPGQPIDFTGSIHVQAGHTLYFDGATNPLTANVQGGIIIDGGGRLMLARTLLNVIGDVSLHEDTTLTISIDSHLDYRACFAFHESVSLQIEAVPTDPLISDPVRPVRRSALSSQGHEFLCLTGRPDTITLGTLDRLQGAAADVIHGQICEDATIGSGTLTIIFGTALCPHPIQIPIPAPLPAIPSPPPSSIPPTPTPGSGAKTEPPTRGSGMSPISIISILIGACIVLACIAYYIIHRRKQQARGYSLDSVSSTSSTVLDSASFVPIPGNKDPSD